MPDLYPLRFQPVYKNYMWGGRRFETALGRTLEPGQIHAESWEIADHGEDQSVVAAGPLAGKTLGELVRGEGESLLGRHAGAGGFPLLLKYLDAAKHLSLQVHPDDRCAAEMGLADRGKTEAWYIVAAEPGSCLWAGFAESADRSSVEEALRDGTIDRLLHRVETRPGDCVFIPAGTVHAVGAGLLVAEIQQMSDNTFRLSDWGRLGTDGKPRQLHIDEGLRAIDYSRGPVEPTRGWATNRPGVTRLAECEQFVLDRWQLDGSEAIDGDSRCLIVTVTGGELTVEGDVCPPLGLGQTLLIPASCGQVGLRSTGDRPADFLVAYVP